MSDEVRHQVVVHWADAHADGEGTWTPLAELADNGEYIVESVGFLLTAGDGGKTGHVSLAQSITTDDMADHIIHIPQGMIRSIKILEENPALHLDTPPS